MKLSLRAMVPTFGRRYQHGAPRRVTDESMMSSETRKKACRSSVNQPRMAVWRWSWAERGAEERVEAVSMTERPRLHFPPTVLCLRDYVGLDQLKLGNEGVTWPGSLSGDDMRSIRFRTT